MSWPELTEGWTGDVPFVLEADGVAVDLTGATVALSLKTQDGRPVDTTTNVTVVTPAAGEVRYTPDDGDLLAKHSPYLARFKITLAGGRVIYAPNGREDKVTVYAS